MNNTDNQISVLILDDGSDFRQLVRDRLTRRGFRVLVTTSVVKEALECIRTHHPDVVVFDMILPETDGIAFLKEAQKLQGAKPVRYVAVSSVCSDVIIGETMRLGASYYMVKPVDPDILAERLGQLVRLPAAPDAPRPAAAPAPLPDLEDQVTAVILEIGIPAHVKGYHYVRSAILLAAESPDTINAVTKIIYPTIAKQYGTSASRVERAIRHAIEVAWDRGNVDTLNAIFGYSVNSNRGKPTNSEFIAMIADRLRLKNKTQATAPAYRF